MTSDTKDPWRHAALRFGLQFSPRAARRSVRTESARCTLRAKARAESFRAAARVAAWRGQLAGWRGTPHARHRGRDGSGAIAAAAEASGTASRRSPRRDELGARHRDRLPAVARRPAPRDQRILEVMEKRLGVLVAVLHRIADLLAERGRRDADEGCRTPGARSSSYGEGAQRRRGGSGNTSRSDRRCRRGRRRCRRRSGRGCARAAPPRRGSAPTGRSRTEPRPPPSTRDAGGPAEIAQHPEERHVVRSVDLTHRAADFELHRPGRPTGWSSRDASPCVTRERSGSPRRR